MHSLQLGRAVLQETGTKEWEEEEAKANRSAKERLESGRGLLGAAWRRRARDTAAKAPPEPPRAWVLGTNN